MSFVWYVDQLGLQVQQELLVLVLITTWSCFHKYLCTGCSGFDTFDLMFAVLVLLSGIAFSIMFQCFVLAQAAQYKGA